MIHFQPNCTIPPEPPAFVTEPNVRSTTNIVWSCISTILLCCWSIQHLNVPPQFQPRTTRQKLMRKLFLSERKVRWMIFTLFAPETILAKAVTERYSCLILNPILKDLADEDGVPWSKSHTFLADMGGFAIRFTPSSHSIPCQYLSCPSVDAEADPIPSQQRGLATMERDGQGGMDVTKEKRNRTRCQKLRRSLSLPNQLLPRNTPNQWGITSMRVYPSAPDGRGLVDTISPKTELQRLLSIPKQENHHATNSLELAQQKLQSASLCSSAAKFWHENEKWSEDRRRFRAIIETASQRFGSIAWRAFLHNENIMIDVLSAPSAFLLADSTKPSTVKTLLAFEGDVWILTAAQLIEARRRSLISRLPDVTEDEVADRNKGDLLIKILALLQVSWMLIQIIARATQRLSSTPLEIMTMSFSACAFITYVLLLDHPQDVNTSIYIDASRLPTADDMRMIFERSPNVFHTTRLPCIPDFSIHLQSDRPSAVPLFSFSILLGAAIFGGLHLMAWNFIFPTVVERTLWRISSLVTMLGLMFYFIVALIWQTDTLKRRFQGKYKRIHFGLFTAFLWLCMLSLVLARLFVIVEAFRSLYYLPQDAYFATWAANAPYIA